MAVMVAKKIMVCMAEPFNKDAIRKGRADRMILRQKMFPYSYENGKDSMITKNHNICLAQDRRNASLCFEKHAGTSEMELDNWILKADDEQILNFLKEILKADQSIDWTGYRVLTSIDRYGYPVWIFELFAKHPESNMNLYSGQSGANVMLCARS